jgi:hypothetical protein
LEPASHRGRRRALILRAAFTLALIAAFAWKPLAGIALVALGAIYLLFRNLDLDATTILSLYLVLLTVIPSTYVIPALGAAGTPAGVVALGCAYWWILERTAPRSATQADLSRGSLQPIRVALAFFSLTSATAFVVAFSRPLTGVEANGAARAMIGVTGLVGVALLAADGMRSRERLGVLVNRLLNLGALMSIVACLQYFTDFDPVERLHIPGLLLNQDLSSVMERSVVNRVASTTIHPIEFGAIVAILLPLAFHTAAYAEPSVRTRRWFRLGLLGLALPLSVSRTAVVVAGVVFLMMWPAWTWARRLRILAGGAAFLLAVRALVKGLLGTIAALFTSFNEDPSTQGRKDDFSHVWTYFEQRPLFGRGLGTFDPTQYFFLDNQIFMTVITAGLFGLAGLLLLVVTAATLARQVFWHGSNDETRHFGAALAASIVGGFFGFLTFDALGFPTFAGLMFLLMGMSGAAWRLEVAGRGRRYTNPRHSKLASV